MNEYYKQYRGYEIRYSLCMGGAVRATVYRNGKKLRGLGAAIGADVAGAYSQICKKIRARQLQERGDE